jgi:hypothetical protein
MLAPSAVATISNGTLELLFILQRLCNAPSLTCVSEVRNEKLGDLDSYRAGGVGGV